MTKIYCERRPVWAPFSCVVAKTEKTSQYFRVSGNNSDNDNAKIELTKRKVRANM